MLIIATCPKPFVVPHISMIQHNAIRSWKRLEPEPGIFLLCNDEGVEEAAMYHDCTHVPGVTYLSERPLMSSIFEEAQLYAAGDDVILYVNTDVLLSQRIVEAIDIVAEKWDRFLVVGERWNWDPPHELSFGGDWWSIVTSSGHLDPPVCADFFAFPNGMFMGEDKMPQFAIGYYAWDTWLVWYSMVKMKVPVIDITSYTLVVHQDHKSNRTPRNHPMSKRNIALLPKEAFEVGGRTDIVPWIMTASGEIVRREGGYGWDSV